MPYNSIISRTDADVLIPTEQADAVIAAATQESVALSLFNRAQLSTKTTRQPVMAALPIAYWVSGDTGLKQTTEAAWAGIDLVAEEIACIVPVPENVVDDSSFDVWGELRPALAEAVAQVLDAAIFAGTAKPASWPAAIVPAAVTAGNVVEQGTATAAQGGIVGDLESTFDAVESDGFDVTGIAATSSLKGLLRKARDSTGQKLTDVSQDSFEGIGISYVMPGVMPTTPPTTAVSGDFTKAIIGVRRDLTYKLLDQAVLTDAAGLVIYNLPMQDMLALRLTARFAYATANPATRVGGSGFPFAVLQNATP